MRWLNVVLVTYAVLMILIGAQGAFLPREGHEGSIVSFIAGGAVGLLILASVALSLTNPRPARIGAAVICLVVLGKFGGDYLRSGAVYPALVCTLLTLVALGCLIAGHFMGMLARRERGRETLPAAFAEKQAREREGSTPPRSEPQG